MLTKNEQNIDKVHVELLYK